MWTDTAAWVQGAGALAALGAAGSATAEASVSLFLRLLETSDLHMFVLDWDYYGAKPDETVGFVKTASLIEAARAESPNCLLFDNGDFLQGNPLGDWRRRALRPRPTVRIPSSD